MNNNLKFDFIVNKETHTVNIAREFAAGLDLVWEAWTNPEMLDQWWAPKPYQSKTKYMDFKVGGRRFYAMASPEGQEHWAVQEFTAISPKTNFKMLNTLADKDENLDLPGSEWDLNFSEQNGTTSVAISIYNESRERMEQMIKRGFKEGIAMAMQNLDQYIAFNTKQ